MSLLDAISSYQGDYDCNRYDVMLQVPIYHPDAGVVLLRTCMRTTLITRVPPRGIHLQNHRLRFTVFSGALSLGRVRDGCDLGLTRNGVLTEPGRLCVSLRTQALFTCTV